MTCWVRRLLTATSYRCLKEWCVFWTRSIWYAPFTMRACSALSRLNYRKKHYAKSSATQSFTATIKAHGRRWAFIATTSDFGMKANCRMIYQLKSSWASIPLSPVTPKWQKHSIEPDSSRPGVEALRKLSTASRPTVLLRLLSRSSKEVLPSLSHEKNSWQ